MCPTITVGSFFLRHERSTFCSFVQQPPQLQTSTTPTSEASKTKRKNKTDVQNLENTLKIPTFFRNYATFWIEIFSPKGPPFNFFLMFCNTMDVKKLQRVPPFTFFGTVTLFKNLIKKIFRKFFHVSKGSPLHFLKKFLQPAGVSKSPKGPPFKI